MVYNNTERFALGGMIFEYDLDKNDRNIKKHGISLKNAAHVFFDYDRIERVVEEATGLKLEDHVNKFKYLNPMKSINNVQTWLEQPKLADDIKFIEKTLSDYLYPFEKHSRDEVKGIPVTDNTKF